MDYNLKLIWGHSLFITSIHYFKIAGIVITRNEYFIFSQIYWNLDGLNLLLSSQDNNKEVPY